MLLSKGIGLYSPREKRNPRDIAHLGRGTAEDCFHPNDPYVPRLDDRYQDFIG